jgi:hypothetical protein
MDKQTLRKLADELIRYGVTYVMIERQKSGHMRLVLGDVRSASIEVNMHPVSVGHLASQERDFQLRSLIDVASSTLQINAEVENPRVFDLTLPDEVRPSMSEIQISSLSGDRVIRSRRSE